MTENTDHLGYGLGFVPLTVAVALDPLETTTAYVRAANIATVLKTPVDAEWGDEEGELPGSTISLAGEPQTFSVLESADEVLRLIERAEVMYRR